jgi:murein DD-endopeptidase MepM/ murein hydrolase activator NlpD
MDRITLIFLPDERSPVRRLRVPRALVRYGPWVIGPLLLLIVLGTADWVRLRLDAHDVAAMREKTAADRAELAALAGELRALEERLARLAEFERKVRVIADLPAALPRAEAPARLGAAPHRDEGGQGGEEPEEEESAAPDVSAHSEPRPEPTARASSLGLDDAVLARIRRQAEELAARMETQGGAFEALLKGLHKVRERLAATPSIWPTDGWVTSGFGWRMSPFTGRRSFHSGLDIAADPGTDIVAAARGRVVFAGRKGPLGQTVVLEHGYGFRTLYGHASALHVRVGETVDRGQRVAAVGSSGRSTGPHLHYNLTLDGRNLDPTGYIVD